MEQGYDWTSFALGFGTALLLALIIRWRTSRRGRDLTRPPPASMAPVHLPEELKAKVRLLRAQGRLIEAIKLVRDKTGLGLKEAKDAVETLV